MLNVLYKNVDWQKIEYVGFDMDGTLYDEFDFISQCYFYIAKKFKQEHVAFEFLCNRWLEKGSSYNRIFDESYNKFELVDKTGKEEYISEALHIFRSFEPKIKMTARAKSILEYCEKHYSIFLVTDGNEILQKRKFASLGLNEYFQEKNVIFTGSLPSDLAKPSQKTVDLLGIISHKSVFFGDRDVDKNYAKNSNMQFQMVYNMLGLSQ